MPPLPWRRLLAAATLGTALAAGLVLARIDAIGYGPVELIAAGKYTRTLVHHDIPGARVPIRTGHDGQQFYAVARDPFRLDRVARSLDRPRYRLQRPLYPWLAWMLHPTGGGIGLVWALFAVGLGATVLGGVTTGALALSIAARKARARSPSGEPVIRVPSPSVAVGLAALFPVLPGSIVCLRLSLADTLALALALAAITLAMRGHGALALACAIGAVLGKESMLLVVAGYALWRRDRRGALFVALPALAAVGWATWVRQLVPAHGFQIGEFTTPFHGLADTLSWWGNHADYLPALMVIGSMTFALLVLRRAGLRAPLSWAILLQLGLLVCLQLEVIGPLMNAGRTTMPLFVLSLVTYLTTAPRATRVKDGPEAPRLEALLSRPREAPASAR
jgi:hypothetical protein